jgi:hypothetical protein
MKGESQRRRPRVRGRRRLHRFRLRRQLGAARRSQVRYYLEVPAGDTIADWPDERVSPLRF